MIPLFHKTPTWIQKLYPDFVWKIDTEQKELFLTFDDGPIPEVTEFVLEELAKHEAKATFFCVGDNLVKHPEIAQKVVQQGHVFGNHTFNHLKGWQTPNDAYWKNVEKCEEQILDIQHSRHLFRPPYGRIKRSQAAGLKQYKTVMWNRLAWDFEKNLNTDLALKYLTDDAPNGSIFVFHDNVKSYHNMKTMLPEVLRYYTKKGFSFNALS
jgi:peptidoglycan/xylan/chitin deacetylase (PgdA/CDA1 family)